MTLDSFQLEELEAFRAAEGDRLSAVVYYLRLHGGAVQFLYAVELLFEQNPPLLLSAGEAADAIRLIRPEALVRAASELQNLHGEPQIQRVKAPPHSLWQAALGAELQAVRLSKNDGGWYANDALLLDFGAARILLALSPEGGLRVSEMP